MKYTEISVNGSASNIVSIGDVKITWKMHNGRLHFVRLEIPDHNPITIEARDTVGSRNVQEVCGDIQSTFAAAEQEIKDAQDEWDHLHAAMQKGEIEFEPITLAKAIPETTYGIAAIPRE